MQELTLILIRFGFLAMLWIFVLGAISVIRSDMFGARVEAPRRSQPPEQRASQKASQVPQARQDPARRAQQGRRSSTAPTPAVGRRSTRRRSSSAAAPTPRSASTTTTSPPATPASAPPTALVRRGPRLHERHLHRHPATHPGHRGPARHAGPRRQDDPRAEEVARAIRTDAPPGRERALRCCGTAALSPTRSASAPQGEPGLRLRQRHPAGHRRRRRRRGVRRRRQRDRRAAAAPARRRPAHETARAPATAGSEPSAATRC